MVDEHAEFQTIISDLWHVGWTVDDWKNERYHHPPEDRHRELKLSCQLGFRYRLSFAKCHSLLCTHQWPPFYSSDVSLQAHILMLTREKNHHQPCSLCKKTKHLDTLLVLKTSTVNGVDFYVSQQPSIQITSCCDVEWEGPFITEAPSKINMEFVDDLKTVGWRSNFLGWR